MDRAEWLDELRRAKVRRFDTVLALDYDEHWAAIGETHRACVERLAATVPPGEVVLDAACGTGRMFPVVQATGRFLRGADASEGMLAEARRKHPDVPVDHVALQALAYDAEFGAAMCVDALENLPPEDWPGALAGLRRAVRPGAAVYLTVEIADPAHLARMQREARAAGLPVVAGEDAGPEGRYHYHPAREQVRGWLAAAGFAIDDEADGDGYWHLFCRAVDVPAAGVRGSREDPTASWRALAIGTAVFAAVGVSLLLVAGAWGTTGVLIAAAVEAVLVYVLYRWSPA